MGTIESGKGGDGNCMQKKEKIARSKLRLNIKHDEKQSRIYSRVPTFWKWGRDETIDGNMKIRGGSNLGVIVNLVW